MHKRGWVNTWDFRKIPPHKVVTCNQLEEYLRTSIYTRTFERLSIGLKSRAEFSLVEEAKGGLLGLERGPERVC